MKHFSFANTPYAMPAAVAAEAAGQQGKFFEFYDLLFKTKIHGFLWYQIHYLFSMPVNSFRYR